MKRFISIALLAVMLSGCAAFTSQERLDRSNRLLDECYKNQGRAIVIIDSLLQENYDLKQELESCRDQ